MAVERDSDVVDGLVDASDGVAKDRFDPVAERAVNRGREIAERQAGESAAGGARKRRCGESRHFPAVASTTRTSRTA
jgi:hypothetical protein